MHEFDSPFFILRTPLLPLNTISEVFNSKNIEDRLLELYNNNEIIREAILLASPDLKLQLDKLSIEYHNMDFDKKSRIFITFLSYIIRMSYRSTPFGLFAGVTIGSWSNENKILLKNNTSVKRNLNIDIEFFAYTVRHIFTELSNLENVKYYINNTLYTENKKHRFYNRDYIVSKSKYINIKKNHKLIKIQSDEINSLLIKIGANGLTFSKLLQVVVDQGYTLDESKTYIRELINIDFLISEFEPNITGENYFLRASRRIKELNLTITPQIKRIEYLLEKINSPKTQDYLTLYSEISNELKTLAPVDSNNVKNTIKADMYKPGIKVTLSKQIISNIPNAIKILTVLDNSHDFYSDIKKFERAFFDRYEYRTISLMAALDNEIGLGYGNNLNESDFDKYSQNPLQENNFNEISRYKLDLYEQSLKHGLKEVQIDVKDLPKSIKTVNLPIEITAFINVYRENSEFLIRLKSALPTSGAMLIGRFGNSKELKSKVKELIDLGDQSNNDKVFAEIVHLPSDRIANIGQRPSFKKFEIPIITKSLLPDENIIPLSDLYLFYKNNKLVLWSKKLKSEVIPRLNYAHNFAFNSISVYKFLCDLQFYPNGLNAFWNWGFLKNQSFLPRITYKNIILELAKWNIPINKNQILLSKTYHQQKKIVDDWRKKYNIPQKVVLVIADNNLVLDLEIEYCVKILMKKVKKMNMLTLQEHMFNKSNSLVSNNEGCFTNEVIIPLFSNKTNFKDDFESEENNISLPKIQRFFPPGSKWYYVKIYTSDNFLEEVLLELYKNMIANLQKRKMIKKWFFIRYKDPQKHLRLRMELHREEDIVFINSELNKTITPYLNNGSISKIVQDTYVREIERYKENTMIMTEDYFMINSQLCIALMKFLSKLSELDKRTYRFYSCIYGVDLIYESLNIPLKMKNSIYKKMSINSIFQDSNSFEINKKYAKTYYSQDQKKLEKLKFRKEMLNKTEKEFVAIFDKYNHPMSKIINEIYKKQGHNDKTARQIAVIQSHMFMNRMIINGSAFWEPLIYLYLFKLNSSFINSKNIV